MVLSNLSLSLIYLTIYAWAERADLKSYMQLKVPNPAFINLSIIILILKVKVNFAFLLLFVCPVLWIKCCVPWNAKIFYMSWEIINVNGCQQLERFHLCQTQPISLSTLLYLLFKLGHEVINIWFNHTNILKFIEINPTNIPIIFIWTR